MVRSELEKELHDLAVQQIAEARFIPPALRYSPGQEHPTWKTYVNLPTPVMPLKGKKRNAVYPDIIIVDTEQNNLPKVACEVESAASINEQAAVRWKACSGGDMKFFLYVPEGCATKAAGILLGRKIPIKRLRTYAFDELWRVRITAV